MVHPDIIIIFCTDFADFSSSFASIRSKPSLDHPVRPFTLRLLFGIRQERNLIHHAHRQTHMLFANAAQCVASNIRGRNSRHLCWSDFCMIDSIESQKTNSTINRDTSNMNCALLQLCIGMLQPHRSRNYSSSETFESTISSFALADKWTSLRMSLISKGSWRSYWVGWGKSLMDHACLLFLD